MCIFQSLSQLVFSCSQGECQDFCINELYSTHIALVSPSLINSLSSLNQGNPLLTILSKQLLSRESLAQYIILILALHMLLSCTVCSLHLLNDGCSHL